ncbi:hypothetical protein SAMN06265338_103204 [Rhodoblastus acidophilus]|uniref:Uncharacterized protein n=1 Tax=Rhodoblastus acidophilus TaxID=1074 RepID=A0A212RB07_RHOAC|nr:hypothetical protein [Rhodoblastus acidophilus]MCW2317460.1 hypothetical protein [Rhodoblastus acidophilus]SNB69353.1 hypothetical protein SAMN06265338_103204 [Rhodoblastus acidophilus]
MTWAEDKDEDVKPLLTIEIIGYRFGLYKVSIGRSLLRIRGIFPWRWL